MNKAFPYWIAWFVFTLVAAAIAMLYTTAAYVDGQYIPVSNDSFYHATRIIDAAIGERGFYQFDSMIHVPDGSWITWPWAYDYLMSVALRIGLWVHPEMSPMKFLAHVPVFWVFVNTGILTLIAREVRLGIAPTAIALLAFSLSPLTQNLHGLGLIDHHFIELTFMLLVVLSGLRFFERQQSGDAVFLGFVLGIASAFHNGLFVLQIPVLATVFLLWLRSAALPSRSLLWLGGTLFVATFLVVLPSAAFHDLQFEFWTLSWFHLYVAFGSAVVLIFLALRHRNNLDLGLLALLGLAMLVPIFAKLATGVTFLAGELEIIRNISEVQSPVSRWFEPEGIAWVTSLYSWLILAAPPLVVFHLVALFRKPKPDAVFLSVVMVFGIVLLLSQYRLHPFGSWALILGSLLIVDVLRQKTQATTLVTTAITLAILAIALQPPLRHQLFKRAPPGLDRDYAASRSLYPVLAEACSRSPGTVLALADDGHPVRYHTDCSVIVNNFLITPLHKRKLQHVDALLQMRPKEILKTTDIRYVFVRLNDVFFSGPDGVEPSSIDVIKQHNSPLFLELAFARSVPEGYRLIAELRVNDERDFAFARIFEITRDAEN